jgi:flagellar basal-body rod modification protein FlgD
MSIGSISGTSNGSSLYSSAATIAGNFNTFLQLLTTQLQNQNPLDPLDTNQFTEQLVQFSSVEQQLQTNQYLEALILANQSTATTQTVSFIGKEITASTTLTNLKDGEASWLYFAEDSAETAYITIKDADGNTVYTTEMPLEGGEGRFDWDGISDTGEQLEDGVYQIEIDARNEDGNSVAVTTEMVGIVDGIDYSGNEPYLIIGDSYISLASVTSVRSVA